MLRIGKLSDYGLVMLTHFAEVSLAGRKTTTRNSRQIADATRLPYPVVSKILKSLVRKELLVSQRGTNGGYALARAPEGIRVTDIIEAIEGPISLMECSAGPGHCDQEATCRVRNPWQIIDRTIRETLDRVTLADLAQPTSPHWSALKLVTLPNKATN